MRRIPPARTAGSSASRVVRYHRYGGPEVLTVDVVPIPAPGSGQVRVRVRAAGVNAIDWKRRRGLFAHGEPLRKPAGTGIEVSGTIDAVGPDPPGWRVGQDVLGQVPTGAAATHVLAASDNLVAKPHWLAFEQAAALPVAAETASRTLRQLVLGKIVLAVPGLSFIAPLHGTRSGWMVEGPERITATSYALDCAS